MKKGKKMQKKHCIACKGKKNMFLKKIKITFLI